MNTTFTCEQYTYCSRLGRNWRFSFLTGFKKISISLFLLFTIFLSVHTLGQGVGSTVLGFEVDANFKSNNIPSFWKFNAPNQTYFPGQVLGDDWSKGTAGNAVLKQLGGVSVPGLTADRTAIWQVDGNWGTDVPPDMSVFAGSSNKNGDNIGAGQNPYTITTGSGGPQKNDITNVFLHTRRNSTALWLIFGAETRSVNGSSYLDFEYNQAGVTTSGGFMIGQGLVGGRTVNDILLVVNYTKGGSVPVVGIRKWQANATWSDELPLTTGNSFMTTNSADVDAVAPLKAFAGDGTPSSTSIAYQFVEGAINISALDLGGLDQCTPNATVTVKTRTSASYTSELKDWDILHFPLTPTSMSAVTDIGSQCRALNGTNIFNVTGAYADGTPTWSSTGGTLSNQSYINGVASATLTVIAPTTSATVTLTTASPNVNCASAVTSKTATINENPTVLAGASPAGNVSIGAAPPHYSLSTTVNSILNNAGYNYSWSQDPPQGPTTGTLSSTIIANPDFTANIAQSFTWTVSATDKVTGCFASSPVTRVLDPTAGCPNVPTSPVCAGTTNTYTADGTPGSTETWIWSVNNGAALNTTAPNPANGGQFIAVTAGTQNFTLTLTKTFANTTLPDGVCTYDVIVNPPGQVNQPGNQVVCNNTTTTLVTFTTTKVNPTTTYAWTNNTTSIGLAASGSGNIAAFTAVNTSTATVVATIVVTPTFTSEGVSCQGASKTLTITVNPTGKVNQPSNQILCNGTSTTLVTFATINTGGTTTYAWTNNTTSIGLAASGNGNIAAFTATNSGNSPIVATITVTPTFTNDGSSCAGPAKTFTITVNPDAAAPLVTYIPPTCTQTDFSVQVTNPQVGSTYKLTQLDGNIVTLPASGGYVSGNLIFSGLHIGQGYSIMSTTAAGCKSLPNECGSFNNLVAQKSVKDEAATDAKDSIITRRTTKESITEPVRIALFANPPAILATPNPFIDNIRFLITSEVSGNGSLELYNMLGQKVHTVYMGYFDNLTSKTLEYNVPVSQRASLIYILRIGNKKISGKLISVK